MSLSQAALLALIGTTYLGGFSRFTHGRFTPGFYKYQTDRAPDNESTRIIPFIDVTLATLLVISGSRAIAAGLCTLFRCVGVGKRVKEGKSLLLDVALTVMTAYVTWSSITDA
ncbi:hypothetical protein B0J13DRAFT_543204 [Dactylonectria estremocensis]|uniref:Uncharacterized protein n=1 Tax=Dactylonectria estremocensis TaxID=1079267 RepID=A0A9P9FB27_9HYPO|nr:hypothetical protein B0J13DRAFT_543204 [Dactylonectria estremocensis]